MDNYKTHNINKHTGNFHCSTCGKCYSTEGQLQNHITAVHLGMVHKCPVVDCKTHFLSKKGLNNHLSLHNSKKDAFLCNICGLDFNSLSKLKYHKISTQLQKNMNVHGAVPNLVGNFQAVKSNMHTKLYHLTSQKYLKVIQLHQQFQKVKKKVQKSRVQIKKEVDESSLLLPFTCAICHQCLENRESVHKHMGVPTSPVQYIPV